MIVSALQPLQVAKPPTNVTGFANQPTRGRRPWLFWALIGVSALGIFRFAGGVRPIF
jgi:hypothetical protein